MKDSARPGRRARTVVLGLSVIGLLGGLIALVPQWDFYTPEPPPQPLSDELSARFEQGVALLSQKNYRGALIALHRVIELAPTMPEAHVNMGFALLGLERVDAAADFFLSAIELRPRQANAYYGLAMALEKQDDLAGALGAMRSFIHLSTAADPYLRRARSAIWEWETRLQPLDGSMRATPP